MLARLCSYRRWYCPRSRANSTCERRKIRHLPIQSPARAWMVIYSASNHPLRFPGSSAPFLQRELQKREQAPGHPIFFLERSYLQRPTRHQLRMNHQPAQWHTNQTLRKDNAPSTPKRSHQLWEVIRTYGGENRASSQGVTYLLP